MSEKILSVFIDESGDFGSYESHAPFYIISMVLHNQQIDIDGNIIDFEAHMRNMGYGQHAKILTSVFRTLYTHVEFRKVRPTDYKLFQVADLICTMELLSEKAASNSFSDSELEFFGNVRDFKKNYLKHIYKKRL